MTDFIQELASQLNQSFNLTITRPEDIKALVIAAADNTLKAAVANQHHDTLTKDEIAYIVAGLTVGIDPRIKAGLKPKG
jgi:hypothetical protein